VYRRNAAIAGRVFLSVDVPGFAGRKEDGMKRAVWSALVLAVVLPFAAYAQAKPDFSGMWHLDASRSDQGRGGRGGRGGGAAMVTIKQTADTLTIESEGRGGMQTLNYKLDGSESKNEMPGRGGTTTAMSKAHWDGAKLIIETTRDFNGMSITSTETRSLTADGKEMTVDTSISTPQGDVSQHQVYTKGM
jgi:hypothetical protein